MQTRCLRSVKSESADEQNTRNGIGRLSEAGTREIVMHKTLSHEAGEQPLHNALLQVHLNDFLGHDPRVWKLVTFSLAILLSTDRKAEAVSFG